MHAGVSEFRAGIIGWVVFNIRFSRAQMIRIVGSNLESFVLQTQEICWENHRERKLELSNRGESLLDSVVWTEPCPSIHRQPFHVPETQGLSQVRRNGMGGGGQPVDSARNRHDRCRIELAPLDMEPVLRHIVTSF